jgi:arylformamidase
MPGLDEHHRAFSRRTLITAAVSGAALAAAGPALAQQPGARPKGPRVWLDMDQQELDDAYDQSKYAPNIQQVLKRYETNSDAVRQRLGEPRRLTYGTTSVEWADLFATRRPNAPIHVFIHGGAWRGGLARNYAFPAETFVAAGAHYIAVEFTNVTQTNGDMAPMAHQVRSALAWIYRNAASFGGDANRIYLSGHSSGGHLAGVATVTDWERDFGVPKDVIKGALLVSGIYDLKPARLSARSSYVKFTDEVEQALSPQRHLDKLSIPLVLAYGTFETPEFQRQTRDFAAAVKAAGKPVTLLVADGYNHFEIIETLANPHGLLGRAALAQMGLTASG